MIDDAIRAKVKRLRWASRAAWCLCVIVTAAFIVTANQWTGWRNILLAGIGAALLQALLTETQSALFTGLIPPPWSKQRTPKTIFVWCCAIVTLLVDIFIIQSGGAGTFLRHIEESTSGSVLSNEFKIPEGGVQLVTNISIVTLAFFSAVGSEILKMFADILEQRLPKLPPISEHHTRGQQPQQKPAQTQEQPKPKPKPQQPSIDQILSDIVAPSRSER